MHWYNPVTFPRLILYFSLFLCCVNPTVVIILLQNNLVFCLSLIEQLHDSANLLTLLTSKEANAAKQ